MELIIAFIIAMVLLWLAAEPETLAEYSDRAAVNRLADRSRKADAVRSYRRRGHVQRPAYKYAAVYEVARK